MLKTHKILTTFKFEDQPSIRTEKRTEQTFKYGNPGLLATTAISHYRVCAVTLLNHSPEIFRRCIYLMRFTEHNCIK